MELFFHSFLSRNRSKIVQTFFFFAIFYLYLWLIVQPILIYHGGGQITNFPVFYTDITYFNNIVMNPGGLIEYLSGFLSQLLILSWLGSLILTAHAFGVCFFTRYILKKIGFRWYNIVSFIPAVLLLITYNSYTYHFTATLALLAVLVAFAVFIKYESDKENRNVLLFNFLFVFLYLAASGLSFYFCLLCILYQLLIKRRYLLGIIECFLAAISGLILTYFIFNLRLENLFYNKLLPFSSGLTHYPDRRLIWAADVIFLLLPVLVSLFGIWRLLFEKRFRAYVHKLTAKSKSHKAKKDHTKTIFERIKLAFVQSRFLIGFNLLLPFVIAVPAVWRFSDASEKPLYKLCFYTREKNWSEVLRLGYNYQYNYPFSYHFNHASNWALYHKGLLLSDMFSLQQNPASLFFTSKNDLLLMEQQAGIFYDLGCVNESEQLLVELFEAYGWRPEILKELAVLKLAKNDTNTARVYLGALSNTLFYRGWAINYLKKLDADPALLNDADIQRLRSLMPQKDNVFFEYSIEDRLTDLLQKDKKNKMAYEYLMAYYLFAPNVRKIIENLPGLDDFNYPQIPRHIEEAILVYTFLEKNNPNLKGRTISSETQKRFSAFLKVVSSRITISQLQQEFGDTYEFYYGAGKSGKTKK